jgi:hypothetical protein
MTACDAFSVNRPLPLGFTSLFWGGGQRKNVTDISNDSRKQLAVV